MIGFPCTRAALDLGTANTRLYVQGRGIAMTEPSLVTVRTSTGDIEAVGGEAEAGLGRTPRSLSTARPVRAGTVSDLKLCEGMLARFLGNARISCRLRRFDVAMAVPSGTTEVERLALVESLRGAGASDVLLVDQVLAAARGAGLSIDEARGHMVVNIGAGVTDIAILSLANAVYARAVRVAGCEMDESLTACVRSIHQLAIGERTAELLKMQIGSALPDSEERSMRIKGRCLKRGIPREAVIRSSEVRHAIAHPLRRIVEGIREALDQAPPELSADLIDTGIILTGGSALLRGLDKYIGADCGLPVKVAHDPLCSVILGLAWQVNSMRTSDWRRFGIL